MLCPSPYILDIITLLFLGSNYLIVIANINA